MPRTPSHLSLLLAIAMLTAACGGSSDPLDTAGNGSDDAIGSQAGPMGAWVLADATPAIDVPDGVRVTMTVDAPVDGTASVGGTAACNGYGGDVDITDGGWGMVGYGYFITEMGCEPAIQAAEQAYMGALQLVASWERPDATTLVLRGDGVELRFAALQPVEAASFTDTVWIVDSFVRGIGDDGAVSSTIGGAPDVLVQFAADGSFLLDTGCELFTGEWTTSGDEVVLPSWGVALDDREPCDEPAQRGADAQRQNLLDVLEANGFTAEVDGQRLTLTNGDRGLGLRPQP